MPKVMMDRINLHVYLWHIHVPNATLYTNIIQKNTIYSFECEAMIYSMAPHFLCMPFVTFSKEKETMAKKILEKTRERKAEKRALCRYKVLSTPRITTCNFPASLRIPTLGILTCRVCVQWILLGLLTVYTVTPL